MNLTRGQRPPVGGYRHSPPLTIRWAKPADAEQLEILAELDEARIPPAPLLLGLVDDELWVAASLCTGEVISDPFRPSAEVVNLVVERGRQLTVPEQRPGLHLGRLRRGAPRAGLAARLGETI